MCMPAAMCRIFNWGTSRSVDIQKQQQQQRDDDDDVDDDDDRDDNGQIANNKYKSICNQIFTSIPCI